MKFALTKMKKCYIIIFELQNPSLNQDKLIRTIKKEENWARISKNSFIIYTLEKAVSIRDRLLNLLYQGDCIYVSKLSTPAAWYGLDNEVSNWIRSNQK